MENNENQTAPVEEQISDFEKRALKNEEYLQQGTEQGIPGMAVPQIPDYSQQIQQAQQAAQQAAQNVNANAPNAIEQFQTRAGALLKGRSVEEEAAWRAEKQAEYAEAGQRFEEETRGSLPREAVAVVAGGAADAVESIGDFAELTGDTIKTKWNGAFGRQIDPTQDPFDPNYIRGDGGWLDIPDHLVPENKTALGKLARGFAEFGFLLAATGGVGGVTGGAVKGAFGISRAAGVATKGSKVLRFVKTGATVAAEGAVADLIMDDEANLMNLVDEQCPWMSPMVKNVLGVNALKVNPEDNPWLAKLKAVLTGAGFNLTFHTINAFARAKWAAGQAKKAGATDEAANALGNKVYEDEWLRAREADEAAATEVAGDRYEKGLGISHADNRQEHVLKHLSEEEGARILDPNATDDAIEELEKLADARAVEADDVFDWDNYESKSQAAENRQPDPFVNPRKFNDTERATYTKKDIKQFIKETSVNVRHGDNSVSSTPLYTETGLKRIVAGDETVYQFLKKVSNPIVDELFDKPNNTKSWKELQDLSVRQAMELAEVVAGADPKKAAQKLRDYFSNNKTDSLTFMHDGVKVVTGTAPQRVGLQLLVHGLAKQASDISRGALSIADDLPIERQVEMVMDTLEVALVEYKKIGFMVGRELAEMKLSPFEQKKAMGKRLKEITQETHQHFNALRELNKAGKHKDFAALKELYALSDGNVRTMDHLHEWLDAKLKGGDMGKGSIAGRWRNEAQSVFYNSILSSLKTPIDAVVSTVGISISRPAMQWVGALKNADRKEMEIAWAGIDAIANAWKESIDMANYNWKLGMERKNMSYQGKYDVQGDIADWSALKPFYEKYGDQWQKRGYYALDTMVKVNSAWWMKYSANAMGSGDALSRTIIGRYNMRMKAAREAIDSGIDLNDVQKVARETEARFRKEIFKQNKDGKWIVHDKATKLAGDEATMTKALEGWQQGLQKLQNAPFGRALFPFIKTGVNALDLTWQHAGAPGQFYEKYRHLKKGLYLEKYGLKKGEEVGELMMMEGRLATGRTILGMAFIATLTGNMTGDYPYDREGRDAWIAAGIKPHSFRFAVPFSDKRVYVSYKDIEPFNTLFAMSANMAQNMDILGEDLFDNWSEKLVFMTAATLVDKSMLAGVKDLAELMNPQRAEGQFTRTFSRYGRSHLPWAGLSGQWGGIIDSNAKEANTFLEMLGKRDLAFKSAIPNKYDMLSKDRSGKPLNMGAETPLLRLFNAHSPVAITIVDDDPVKQAIVDMRYNLPDVVSHVNGVPLNSDMKSELQKHMSMGDLRKNLEEIIIHDKNWRHMLEEYKRRGYTEAKGQKLTDQKWYQVVHKVFQHAKKKAWAEVLANNPDFRDQINTAKTFKKLGQAGSYDNIDQLRNFAKPQNR